MKEPKRKKTRLEKEIEEIMEIDEESEHPLHERFVKQKKIRKLKAE